MPRSGQPHLVESLSVIFPAYNEQHNLRRTVEKACACLPTLARKWEVIIVNDGSRDETNRVCDQIVGEFQNVFAFHHPSNRGYGAALKTGIIAASGDFIFFTDSDGQFDLAELRRLIAHSGEYDIVCGYRRKRKDHFMRLVNAWGWNTLVRAVLGLRIRDVDCAFKLFKRPVFRRVQIRAVGAMVNTEILAQAMRLGMRIREVEVTHYPRIAGRPTGARLSVIMKAFRELCHLWWKLGNIDHNQEGLYNDILPVDDAPATGSTTPVLLE